MADDIRDAGGGNGVHALLVSPASHYLARLARILTLLDDHIRARGLDETEVLDTPPTPGMLPLRMHIRIAMDFPFRALDQGVEATRARKPIDMRNLAGLSDSLSERRAWLGSLTPESLQALAFQILTDRAGEADVALPAPQFISLYLLPNFFFHLSAAYLTCRVLGVGLGKGDFDGFHTYFAEPVA